MSRRLKPSKSRRLSPGTLVKSNSQYYFWNEIDDQGPRLQGFDPEVDGAGIILGYLAELDPALAEKARFWFQQAIFFVAVLIGDTVWYVDHDGLERVRKQK